MHGVVYKWRVIMYPERAREVVKDLGSSDWIKKAIVDLDRRDIVDVLNELELLQELFVEKFDYMKAAVEANRKLKANLS
jgi:hypothetical protein